MEQRKRKNHFDLKANAIEAQISGRENGNIEQKTNQNILSPPLTPSRESVLHMTQKVSFKLSKPANLMREE
jgi:hypothetical protein